MLCEDNLCRTGRGAVSDVEIRNVGSPIVLGEIPGIVAIVGSSNYPKGGKDVYDIAREFASRRYIVALSGCSAMSAGSYRNSEGKTLYEEFPGTFEGGGVINVGSCVRKQPHRRCSNQSSKHLRKTPTQRQLRRNRRLHPQPSGRSRFSLGCLFTESSRDRRRLLALRCASACRSTRSQIQTYAPWQKRRPQELGSPRRTHRPNR